MSDKDTNQPEASEVNSPPIVVTSAGVSHVQKEPNENPDQLEAGPTSESNQEACEPKPTDTEVKATDSSEQLCSVKKDTTANETNANQDDITEVDEQQTELVIGIVETVTKEGDSKDEQDSSDTVAAEVGSQISKEAQDQQDDQCEARKVKISSTKVSQSHNESQEVSSTKNDASHHNHHPGSKHQRSSRRPSYNSTRSFGGGPGGSFQNYGLTYLPYRSNFEPSEDARRRADEFLKTMKMV